MRRMTLATYEATRFRPETVPEIWYPRPRLVFADCVSFLTQRYRHQLREGKQEIRQKPAPPATPPPGACFSSSFFIISTSTGARRRRRASLVAASEPQWRYGTHPIDASRKKTDDDAAGNGDEEERGASETEDGSVYVLPPSVESLVKGVADVPPISAYSITPTCYEVVHHRAATTICTACLAGGLIALLSEPGIRYLTGICYKGQVQLAQHNAGWQSESLRPQATRRPGRRTPQGTCPISQPSVGGDPDGYKIGRLRSSMMALLHRHHEDVAIQSATERAREVFPLRQCRT
ncbi:hypothetical protein PG984_012224 [Apiospora sp. TS-2023a]